MPKRQENPKEISADVVIVGGGLAGACLAVLLADQNINVACIDHEDPGKTLAGSFDGRTTAISFGSQKIMAQAGLWAAIEKDACPIETIRILEQGSSYLTFEAAEISQQAFGWIVENRLLRSVLYRQMAALKTCRHLAPAKIDDIQFEKNRVVVSLQDGRIITAPLLVGADGKNSYVRDLVGIDTRGRIYDQQANVCIVRHRNPHNGIAVEDFRHEGPFAILPMMDGADQEHRSSVVWTQEKPKRQNSTRNDAAFAASLTERFPGFYGTVEQAGPIFSYPLSLSHAHRYTAPRCALIADAAHAIHPIAGQGLNLGLRDVETLAKLIADAVAEKGDVGSATLLAKYERLRRPDNMAMAGATDALNMLFSNHSTVLGLMRRTGLKLVGKTPPAKKFFMRYAMGLSRLSLSR